MMVWWFSPSCSEMVMVYIANYASHFFWITVEISGPVEIAVVQDTG